MTMKAILTKYLGATNTQPSRIKAWAEGGNSITVSYNHDLSGLELHREAAIALVKKMDWAPCLLVGGGTPDGYVFVMADAADHYQVSK